MKKLCSAVAVLGLVLLFSSCKKEAKNAKAAPAPAYGTFTLDSKTYAPDEFSSSASGSNWCMAAIAKGPGAGMHKYYYYNCKVYTAGGQAPADGIYNLTSSTTSLGANDACVILSWSDPEGWSHWSCTSTSGIMNI